MTPDRRGPHPAAGTPQPQTYRVKQVAAMLNVPVSTVYDWVRARAIACVRVGTRSRQVILIRHADLEEFLDRNRLPSRT